MRSASTNLSPLPRFGGQDDRLTDDMAEMMLECLTESQQALIYVGRLLELKGNSLQGHLLLLIHFVYTQFGPGAPIPALMYADLLARLCYDERFLLSPVWPFSLWMLQEWYASCESDEARAEQVTTAFEALGRSGMLFGEMFPVEAPARRQSVGSEAAASGAGGWH